MTDRKKIGAFVKEADRFIGDGTYDEVSCVIDFARALRYIKELLDQTNENK